MKVQDYLNQKSTAFELLTHSETFDAQHMAQAVHVPGAQVAKTVVLQLDNGYRFAVAVLPATHQIDFKRVSEMLGGAAVELITKEQLAKHCLDCELGAIPPFGNLYGMMTLLDEALMQNDDITFEGNRHCESIRMKLKDFIELEHPLTGAFAIPRK